LLSSDLVFLLLPVAAAAGWWSAHRSIRKKTGTGNYETNPEYFRGLNYLLNEEPDKAIDVFVELLEVDNDTVETHLALGNLFRRRGEVERAIRIHQNLIARPALTRQQRAYALFELGQDYMKAGLYDRAENLFKELDEIKLHRRKALKNLLVIYEAEKDWESCLSISEKLGPLVEKTLGMQRSHYCCELAIKALSQNDLSDANKHLKHAQNEHATCIRAFQIEADIAIKESDFNTAIGLLKKAADQSPAYISEILSALLLCHAEINIKPDLRLYLERFIEKQPHSTVLPYLIDLIKEEKGDVIAMQFLATHIKLYPSLSGLMNLLQLNTELPDATANEILQGVKNHMQILLSKTSDYKCNHCGYIASTMHWQCPSCRSWSTIKHQSEMKMAGTR